MSAERKLRFGRYTVELSSLDRVLFPDVGVTKGDLVEHYRKVAGRMVPHLKGRPVSMQRFPGGIEEEGFFQKAAPDYFPDWIARVKVRKEGGMVEHVVCDNAATLVYLANQGCITPHVWLPRGPAAPSTAGSLTSISRDALSRALRGAQLAIWGELGRDPSRWRRRAGLMIVPLDARVSTPCAPSPGQRRSARRASPQAPDDREPQEQAPRPAVPRHLAQRLRPDRRSSLRGPCPPGSAGGWPARLGRAIGP